MATSNSKPSKVLLTTFITFFLLLLNKGNSQDDLSFNFNKFNSRNGLIFQGDAYYSTNDALFVTWVEKGGVPRTPSRGRVLYSAPVRVWDSSSGKVASFSTSFSFRVKAVDANITADGLAFFLAPIDSQMPSGGNAGLLALFNDESYNSSNQIVAVEFDTFSNYGWDPSGRHIGIDVNTIKSTKTTPWEFKNGEVADVFINYLAPTKTLIVSLTYPSTQTTHVVSAAVDLKAILPEFVRVGFSAVSAGPGQTHDVLNWSFTSSLEGNIYAAVENNMLINST